MVDILELYQLAEEQGHDVYWYTDENLSAVSVKNSADNSCAIAINPFKLESSVDEKYKLAHELGHCETGSFYTRCSPCDLKEKHELRAERWAMKTLLPQDELFAAIRNQNHRWEIAEMFGVPEELVQKAIDYYTITQGCALSCDIEY